LFNYIEGKVVNDKLSKTQDFLFQLGELLAKVHNATNPLKLNNIHKFKLELDFKEDLLSSIKEATSCPTSKDSNYNKLQELIKSHMNYIYPLWCTLKN